MCGTCQVPLCQLAFDVTVEEGFEEQEEDRPTELSCFRVWHQARNLEAAHRRQHQKLRQAKQFAPVEDAEEEMEAASEEGDYTDSEEEQESEEDLPVAEEVQPWDRVQPWENESTGTNEEGRQTPALPEPVLPREEEELPGLEESDDEENQAMAGGWSPTQGSQESVDVGDDEPVAEAMNVGDNEFDTLD